MSDGEECMVFNVAVVRSTACKSYGLVDSVSDASHLYIVSPSVRGDWNIGDTANADCVRIYFV